MPSTFEVIVGNVGTVYNGPDREEADKLFNVYVEQSKLDMGRAGGEDVFIIENYGTGCDIVLEHRGSNSVRDDYFEEMSEFEHRDDN